MCRVLDLPSPRTYEKWTHCLWRASMRYTFARSHPPSGFTAYVRGLGNHVFSFPGFWNFAEIRRFSCQQILPEVKLTSPEAKLYFPGSENSLPGRQHVLPGSKTYFPEANIYFGKSTVASWEAEFDFGKYIFARKHNISAKFQNPGKLNEWFLAHRKEVREPSSLTTDPLKHT